MYANRKNPIHRCPGDAAPPVVHFGRGRRFAKPAALLLCILAAAVPAGCPAFGPTSFDTNVVGVTPGGTQDIAEARAQIRAGSVPDPAAITVEGFLSEHEIPLTPPEDAPEIYASVAVTWRQGFGEPAPGADIFITLGTTVDLASYQRRALNLAVVVDRSGSMNDPASATDPRSKMDAVRQALHSLVNRLRDDDRLAIVTFNRTATLDLASTPGGQRDLMREKIDEIRAIDGTNMFDALRMGFEQVAASADGGRDNRVLLFTDALPNVGPSSSAEFLELIRSQASLGIGFTLMGVGHDYGTQLANDIANVRLANAFYLADAERITRIFEDDFDYFVTPAAFDLVLEVGIPEGVGIRNVYGVPDYVPGTRGARVTIPTLFFSAREGGGAIVVRLTFSESPTFEEDVTIGRMSMSYTLADGQKREMTGDLVLPAGLAPTGNPPYFSEPTARRAAILLDTALVLRGAAIAVYEGRGEEALDSLEKFLAYFDQATLGLSDRTDATSRGLSDERGLIQALIGTIESRSYYYYGPFWF